MTKKERKELQENRDLAEDRLVETVSSGEAQKMFNEIFCEFVGQGDWVGTFKTLGKGTHKMRDLDKIQFLLDYGVVMYETAIMYKGHMERMAEEWTVLVKAVEEVETGHVQEVKKLQRQIKTLKSKLLKAKVK